MTQPNNKGRRADPMIDEIRQIREELDRRFGGDLRKHGEYARQVGEEYRTKTGRFAYLAEKKAAGETI